VAPSKSSVVSVLMILLASKGVVSRLKLSCKESPFDPSIIDQVEQRPGNLSFDQLPSIKELDDAIYPAWPH
jgi:hypothetical protein